MSSTPTTGAPPPSAASISDSGPSRGEARASVYHWPPRAHSSGWLERIPDKDEVPGSNPGGPTASPRRGSSPDDGPAARLGTLRAAAVSPALLPRHREQPDPGRSCNPRSAPFPQAPDQRAHSAILFITPIVVARFAGGRRV